MDFSNESGRDDCEWVFLMQDIRGYIRVFGAEQLLHDFHELFPEEYRLLTDAVQHKKKAALLGG